MSRRSGKAATKLVVTLILAGIAFAVLYRPIQRHMLSQNFPESVLYEYEGLFRWGARGKVRSGQKPYRTGKVVVAMPSKWTVYGYGAMYTTQMNKVHTSKRERTAIRPRLHDSFFDLAPSIRASSPDDVDTVILCEQGKRKVADYVPMEGEGLNYAAYRLRATLHVYDRRSGAYIGSHEILGGHPKHETIGPGNESGSPPGVAGFIDEMPLK